MGVPSPQFLPVLEQLRAGKPVVQRLIGAELHEIQLVTARSMGLAVEWLEKIQKASPERHTLFQILSVYGGIESRLIEGDDISCGVNLIFIALGDIILDCDGKTMTSIRDFNVQYSKETLNMVVMWRIS